ncbi:MAG: DUF7507 domain-containing protein [Chloroflexota bacterium]
MASKKTLWVLIIVLILTGVLSLVLSQVLSSMLSPDGGNPSWKSPVPTETSLPTITLQPSLTAGTDPLLTASPVITLPVVDTPGTEVPTSVITATIVPGSCTYPMEYWRDMPDLLPDYVKIEYISFSRADAIVLMSIEPHYVGINLFQQYYTALMNVRAGTDPSPIQQALDGAHTWLYEHSFGSTLTEEDMQQALELVQTLGAYNNGQTGPGMCADAPITVLPTQTVSQQSCTFPMTYWREQPDLLPDYLKIEYISFSRSDAILLMNSNPKYVSIDLFQQYYAAYVNTTKGSDPTEVEEELQAARQWLYDHSFGSTLTEEDMQQAYDLARTLEYYNNGQIGPGLCATEAELTATVEAAHTITAAAPTRTPRPTILITATNTPERSGNEPRPPAVQASPTTEPPTATQEPPTATTQPTATQEPPTPTEETTPTVAPPLGFSVPKALLRIDARKLAAVNSEMQIEKRAAPNPVVAGNALTYTVTVFNSGNITAMGVRITDTLPAEVTFQSASPGCSHNTGQVICDIGEMITGTEESRVIVVRVDPDAGGTITNQAVVGSESPDPNPANNTATVQTTVNQQADLQIMKSANLGTVLAGNTLTYTLSLHNGGPSTATGVRITDTLPSAVTFQSASGCSHTAGEVVCNVGSMAVNADATRTIVVRVDPAFTGTIGNAATAAAVTTDPNPANNVGTVNTTVNAAADLRLNKTGTPTTVVAGNLLTYTLSLHNAGPSDALAVTVQDTLPSGVTFQSASAGCSHVAGQVTCNLAGLLTNGNANRTVVVRVNSSTTAALSNSATVSANTDDPNSANNTGTTNTAVSTRADMQISKSASSPVIAGDLLTYTLSITNLGPSDARNVVATDSLTFGLVFQSASTGCSYHQGTRVVTCSVGTVTGNTSLNRTVVVRIAPYVTGTLLTQANVSSSTFDPVSTNNQFSLVTTVQTRADLALHVTDVPEAAPPGGSLAYTFRTTNLGPSDAQGVVLTSTLPANFTPGTPSVSCVLTSILTCELGTIPAGQSAQVSLPGTVSPGAPLGTISLEAHVTSDTEDLQTANNHETETTEIANEIADLRLALADLPDPVVAGNILTYQGQVSNVGPSAASGVVFTSTIPASSSFQSASTGQGTCAFNGQLACDLGTLLNGSQVTVTFQVLVSPGATGSSIESNAHVFSTIPDSNSQNNAISPRTVLQTRADLSVTQVDAPDPVKAGMHLTYTLTIDNAGPSNALGVKLVDTLPAGTQFIASDPGLPACVNVNAQLTCNLGTLAAGASMQIQLRARVDVQTSGTIANQATVSSYTNDSNTQNNASTENTAVLDETPPTVSWVLPVSNGQLYNVFNEMVLLRVNTSDNVGVARVVFLRHDPELEDNVVIGEDTAAPYELTLDATTLNFEWNQISALAYDTSGNVSVFQTDQSFIWLYRLTMGYAVYLPLAIR